MPLGVESLSVVSGVAHAVVYPGSGLLSSFSSHFAS